MTPADEREYKRRLAVREQRRAHVEHQAGYTAAPIRVWHFDAHTGETDPSGQRVASTTRTVLGGRR